MIARLKNSKSGFTLIEMLIYVALLSVMSITAVTTILSLQDMYTSYRINQVLRQTNNVVFERMIADIRRADGVDPFSCVFNDPDGLLDLEIAGNPSAQYHLNGGRVIHTDSNGVSSPLTSDDVTVNTLQFTLINDNGETTMVRVHMNVTADFGSASSTMSFYTSAVLRGTYD